MPFLAGADARGSGSGLVVTGRTASRRDPCTAAFACAFLPRLGRSTALFPDLRVDGHVRGVPAGARQGLAQHSSRLYLPALLPDPGAGPRSYTLLHSPQRAGRNGFAGRAVSGSTSIGIGLVGRFYTDASGLLARGLIRGSALNAALLLELRLARIAAVSSYSANRVSRERPPRRNRPAHEGGLAGAALRG